MEHQTFDYNANLKGIISKILKWKKVQDLINRIFFKEIESS